MTIPPALACFFGLSLPALAAWAWLRRAPPFAPPAIAIPFAFVLGLGSSALGYLAWRAAGLPHGAAYVAADVAVFSALSITGLRHGPARRTKERRTPGIRMDVLAAGAVAVGVGAVAAGGIILRLGNHPHGAWDAWAMWNARARFLALAATPAQAFEVSPALHPEYPLLLPASVARLFAYTGQVDPVAAGWISAACALAVGALLWGGLRPRPAAGAAVALLLGTSDWLVWSASMYADVPVAMFVVAAVVALDLADAGGGLERRAAAVAAGLCAGFACCTKPEGMMALAVLVVARAAFAPPGEGAWCSRTALKPFLAGVALPLLAVVIQKVLQPIPNALVANLGPSGLRLLFDPERRSIVAHAFARELVALGDGAIVATAAAAVLLGFRPSRAGLWTLAVPLGMAAGFALIFLVTPYDLPWHLRTALDRVLLQCWPLLLFGLFNNARSTSSDPAQKTSTATSPWPRP